MNKDSPLNELNGYNKLLEYYEENKDKDWEEWLEYDETFPNQGKQGLVGLMKGIDNHYKYVFKLSQYINYLSRHEYAIMEGLNQISPYCPHFCKSFGLITSKVDPKKRKSGNPFNAKGRKIEKEIILTEYISNSTKFYNYIRSKKIPEYILYSTIKQVLLAISIAQKKKRFSHHDLHSENIMMKKCDKDVVFLYVLDEDNQFAVPTHGHYPVIIDFGFSYIGNMDDNPLWTSLAHTDVGFMSDRFDWVSDPKLLLVTVSSEIKEKRKSKKSKKFRRIIRNIFSPLSIEWDSGWDDEEEQGAADYITEIIEEYNDCSRLFDKYEHLCIDIIQSLIILPLEEQNYSKIDKSYRTFLKEFCKIENEIGNPFYNLYVLQGIVDSARDIRAEYLNQDTREWALKEFRHDIYNRVNEIANFCRLKNIHYEKMLCSLLIFSRCSEGILYDVITSRMAEKEKQYRKMPLQSIDQIYAVIEANIESEYEYNENTTVFVFDSNNEECGTFPIALDKIDDINNTISLAHGTILYEMYKDNKK